MVFLEAKGVKKVYTSKIGGNKVNALNNVSFSIEKGEFVAIMGESGSGKTTLLNIIATLDKPTGGDVLLNGVSMAGFERGKVSQFRREKIGFIFQDFNLLDNFSCKDNILLPLVLENYKYEEMEKRLIPIAKKLSIEGILEKYPYEISGGQKQRVAIGRAIITEPQIILADEPTGALDSKSSDKILRLISSINQEGQTVLMVTHSIKASANANRVIFIKDGEVYNQIYRGNMDYDEFYNKISDSLAVLITEGNEV